MRLLDRYLLRELLVPLGFCLGGFLVFWLAFDLLGQLSGFQQRGLGLGEIASFYVYGLPELLGTVLPVGFLLALLYALTNHTRHHEITAIRAAGISIWRLCVPYLGLGLVFSLILHGLGEYVMPGFKEGQEALMRKDRGGTASAALWRERIDLENARERRIWNIGAFHLGTAELKAPRVRMPLEPGARRVLTARQARWTNGGWQARGVVERIHRSAQDPEPALETGADRHLPVLGIAPEELMRWEGRELTVMIPVTHWITNELGRTNIVIPTPTMWRTNLVGETAGGMKWRVGSLDPQRQELKELEVTIPADPSAWRLVIGQAGAWREEEWKFSGVTEYLFRGATDGDPMPMVHAELGLPGLGETPDMIRSELRVASLRRGRTMKRAELTLAEIRDYRRLHPRVPPELEATLETQWHARLAGPWTCLVVVLIAVPFSVAPGRRNLFYGVAGSIGIAFAYFVLQKFGFALGQSGRVPGWMAAWLPNGVFALAGIVLTARLP